MTSTILVAQDEGHVTLSVDITGSILEALAASQDPEAHENATAFLADDARTELAGTIGPGIEGWLNRRAGLGDEDGPYRGSTRVDVVFGHSSVRYRLGWSFAANMEATDLWGFFGSELASLYARALYFLQYDGDPIKARAAYARLRDQSQYGFNFPVGAGVARVIAPPPNTP